MFTVYISYKNLNLITSILNNNQQQTLNQPEQPESLKTPIEIALGIDADGMTTAKRLYEFLEMRQGDYSRWCKKNITENPFAEENVDYEVFVINEENPKGGRPDNK